MDLRSNRNEGLSVSMDKAVLRIKMFSEQFGFTLDFESTRCKYIPLAADQCPGKISECPYIKDRSECLFSGGTTFAVTFHRN
jgi:hypothetical protein